MRPGCRFASVSALVACVGRADPNPQAFHGVEDPNDITVKQDLESVEAAQKLLASEEIKAAMSKARVVGPPTVWIVKTIG